MEDGVIYMKHYEKKDCNWADKLNTTHTPKFGKEDKSCSEESGAGKTPVTIEVVCSEIDLANGQKVQVILDVAVLDVRLKHVPKTS